MPIPRPEHPRPQFYRERWLNLNGTWQFEPDPGCSGAERGLQNVGRPLEGSILVPFCPESKLSGVGNTDFMNGVWYKRTVRLDSQEDRVLLHFGAVDYRSTVFVNGQAVGKHKGGYASFQFDITGFVHPGENEIAVFAADDSRDTTIPSGKQSADYHSAGCSYTRTTGIWQTVWLEFVPQSYIRRVKFEPDIHACSVTMEVQLEGSGALTAEVTYQGRPMGSYRCDHANGVAHFTVPLAEKQLWEVGQGRLYDVKLTFGRDTVSSYFGLRQVRMEGMKFMLNDRSVFQRLVLDQGFYPDGIYTAPTDGDLVRDIKLSLAAGFNGARLHEKVFEERFLYHADRLGYLVWGEYGDWGSDATRLENLHAVLPEWLEIVNRDYNHPAIIGWCPRNETVGWSHTVNGQGAVYHEANVELLYRVTKALDPTRPCIDTSGFYHVVTDIFCVHDYEQDPKVFKERYDALMTEGVLNNPLKDKQTYRGEPTFLSEYGGIPWVADDTGWGYGKNPPKTKEEFIERFRGLTDALLDNNKMFGLCYTQLTDIEQEQNGLYTYRREPKFDMAEIRRIMSRKAAIED